MAGFFSIFDQESRKFTAFIGEYVAIWEGKGQGPEIGAETIGMACSEAIILLGPNTVALIEYTANEIPHSMSYYRQQLFAHHAGTETQAVKATSGGLGAVRLQGLDGLELFHTRANFRRVAIACAIQAATQMTGISAIQYYSVTIFAQVGITGEETLRYQAINSIIGLISEALIMFFVDKVGRRTIIIAGSLLMALTYVVSTVLMAEFPASGSNVGAHWGFIIMTWLFNFCFSSMGSLSWIIPAEIFDTQTRGKGVALATMTSFAFNTMIGQVTPLGMSNVGWRFYILFIVTNVSNALIFWSFLPETGRVPLEDMKQLFTEAPLFIGSRDTAKYVRHEVSQLAHEIEKNKSTTYEVSEQ